MSPDPNIPDPTNTQDYNPYSYVNNNPLTYTDPSGFCADGSSTYSVAPDGTPTLTGTCPRTGCDAHLSTNDTICAAPVPDYCLFDGPYCSNLFPAYQPSGIPQLPHQPPQKPDKPKPDKPQIHQPCSNSSVATAGQSLIERGNAVIEYGETWAATGTGFAISGQVIAGFGVVTVDPVAVGTGESVSAFGVTMAGVGGLIAAGGLAVKGLGAALSWFSGNSQPVRETLLQAAQRGLQNSVDWPEGVPSPLTPVTNALAGSNPCP